METLEHVGFTIEIHQDNDPIDPRKDCDTFGTMTCFHRRYRLGDEHTEYWHMDSDAFSDHMRLYGDQFFILPLALLDHSGLHMWVGSKAHQCDPGGWDSGQVGWIYISKEKARKEMNVKRLSKKVVEKVYEILEGEVKTYDQLLTGDVYGYMLKDGEDVLDSCWNFFGYDFAVSEAKAVAEQYRRDNPFLPGLMAA